MQTDNKNLEKKIDELEQLINKNKNHIEKQTNKDTLKIDAISHTKPETTKAQVPVLDEIIGPSAYGGGSKLEQLEQLIERVEQKLATELEQLVAELKSNMKTNIKKELREQLNQALKNRTTKPE